MTSKLVERDMLQKPMHEVEEIIKANKNDVELNSFATISAIRGEQFGREIYTSMIPFKDLMKFLEVFPAVQRVIIKRRVTSIKKYVLSAIDNPDTMRFFSSLTVTCRGGMFYSATDNKVSIDTNESRLSVNDGQHRFYGIAEAIRELRGKINRAKDMETKEMYEIKLKKLSEMVVPLVIFNQITEREEKQLFHDLNNLAQRPSRSSTIKLAQTDFLSIMAREIAEENEFLKRYGVETNKGSLHANNPNTVLLTTVYAFIKELLKSDIRMIGSTTFYGYKELSNDTLNQVFENLPKDLYVKNKYMIEKNFALKGISKFIKESRQNRIAEEYIFEAIKVTDWTNNLDTWKQYGAMATVQGRLQFGASGTYGIQAVDDMLTNNLKDLMKAKKKK